MRLMVSVNPLRCLIVRDVDLVYSGDTVSVDHFKWRWRLAGTENFREFSQSLPKATQHLRVITLIVVTLLRKMATSFQRITLKHQLLVSYVRRTILPSSLVFYIVGREVGLSQMFEHALAGAKWHH